MLPSYDDLTKRAWWRIVSPVGRRLGDLDADPLVLWSFQSEVAYRTLAQAGVLRGDPAHADPDLSFAYPWMQAKADDRLGTTGDGLLWFWASASRRALIDHAKHARAEVLLTVRMRRDQVLLSDFNDWHFPLNGWLNVPRRPDEDDGAWRARAEPILDDWDDRFRAAGLTSVGATFDAWPADLRAQADESWKPILDRSTWRPDADTQAVAHAIHADQVVSAAQVRPKRR